MRARAEHSLLRQVTAGFVLILLSPILVVLVPIYLALSFSFGLALHIAIWIWWCTRGKYVLLVYSNSPAWQPYFESHLLPTLQNRAVVLNWSARAT